MEQLFEKGSVLFKKYKHIDHVEMELRLGKIYRGGFDTNVGRVNYEIIKKSLENYNEWEDVEESDTSVYYSNNIRTAFDNATDEHIHTIEKTKVESVDVKFTESPYDARFAVSVEKPIEFEGDADTVRVKKRKSFIRKNVRIDITEVAGENEDIDDEEEGRYEIELEIIDVRKVLSDTQLYNTLYKFVCIMDTLKG